MRTFLLRGLYFSITALSASLWCTAAAAAPVRIGVITDLSGHGAYLGKATRLGAEIAADELRANGYDVELVFGDHTLNPAKAVTEAQKLLSLDTVDALFVNFSGPSAAVAPAITKYKKLFVYSGAAISPLRANPFSLKTFVDYRQCCRRVAEYWRASGVKKIGIVKPESEFGELCLEGARQLYPDIEIEPYTIGGDQSQQVLRMKQRGVQALLNGSYEADTLNMLTAIRRFEYKVRLGEIADSFTPQVLRQFADMLEGTVTYGMPDVRGDLGARIRGRDPGNTLAALDHAGMAYLHIRQMANAVARCSGAGIDCQMREMLQSAPDPDFGFRGWKDRVAVFDVPLKQFRQGRAIALDAITGIR